MKVKENTEATQEEKNLEEVQSGEATEATVDETKESETKEQKPKKKSSKKESKVDMVKNESEIPAAVKPILECFSNLEELYVNDKGGVYTKDTPASLVGSAVLYKNPYFKN